MSAQALSISTPQVNALRTMLNNLAGRPYDDSSLDSELSSLTKRQGVMLIKVVGQILKIKSALKSDTTMLSLQPLLDGLGISVSLVIH